MSFVTSNGSVTSFARFSDVEKADQRLFETNEGLTEDVVNPLLKRATERILSRMRSTDWWKDYFVKRDPNTQLVTEADIPPLDANKILDRYNDFTDLCVYTAMADYILPKVADFGTEDNAERNKMSYYVQRTDSLFGELVSAGDWYDFDGSGAISSSEKQPGMYNLKRVR
jgi:N-acetyl-beta-hexosaminidase